ncbi:MAG: DNA translocase FtsK 4TM domain-containing protein [Candidatus Omnitrophica bacterium]|jgi:S-DNA-T family DNA segregation ATPase FtsK/SpoIIIE|nr:DNA translocase FtsK 4TM domain-containing protein [Candidatus Omnitrophota bacterium]
MRQLSSFLQSAILFLLSFLFFLSLVSYKTNDTSLLVFPPSDSVSNLIGVSGAYLSTLLFFIFGYAAYFFPFYLFFLGLSKLKVLRFWGLARGRIVNTIAFILFIIFFSGFLGLFFKLPPLAFENSGGMTGFFLDKFFEKYLGFYGSFITIILLMTINAILLFGFFFIDVFKAIVALAIKSASFLKELKDKKEDIIPAKNKKQKLNAKEVLKDYNNKRLKEVTPEIKVYTPKVELGKKDLEISKEKKPFISIPKPPSADKEEIKKKMEEVEAKGGKSFDPVTYKLPQPSLIKVPPFIEQRGLKEDIEINIRNLEETLSDFSVEAKVVSVQKGPVVTMYELQPQAGTKIQKISALADDIALAMKSSLVRVVAPIPGRGTVGVEIPNATTQLVFLREVLEEKVFLKSSSKLTLAIGKDVSGNPVVADLGDMPHLLIAGATGSGKTVCVNSLISSILFKARPDEVKFILVDPKMVELAPFAGISHLIHPIISEAKKVFSALNWAVEEMERRYQLLSEAGCRNIDAYNQKAGKLPFIIIVIDELADLMAVARENIELTIQRLAQLSRAVGIHLILATQRPSVDVITGVIKANFPARISFKVASKVDSRTVLDMMGADKLLGKGDLLFLKPGAVKLIRAQGSYIDDEDIETLTNFVRAQGRPVYEEAIIQADKNKSLDIGSDELFEEAVKIVLSARQASGSILQRRMRVGYTRAARLLDLMEQEGIVGPFCGSKAREILVDPDSYLREKGLL